MSGVSRSQEEVARTIPRGKGKKYTACLDTLGKATPAIRGLADSDYIKNVAAIAWAKRKKDFVLSELGRLYEPQYSGLLPLTQIAFSGGSPEQEYKEDTADVSRVLKARVIIYPENLEEKNLWKFFFDSVLPCNRLAKMSNGSVSRALISVLTEYVNAAYASCLSNERTGATCSGRATSSTAAWASCLVQGLEDVYRSRKWTVSGARNLLGLRFAPKLNPGLSLNPSAAGLGSHGGYGYIAGKVVGKSLITASSITFGGVGDTVSFYQQEVNRPIRDQSKQGAEFGVFNGFRCISQESWVPFGQQDSFKPIKPTVTPLAVSSDDEELLALRWLLCGSAPVYDEPARKPTVVSLFCETSWVGQPLYEEA